MSAQLLPGCEPAELLYSVLLPTHRDDEFLRQAITSVEAAMGSDAAELIIVANGPARNDIAARFGGADAPSNRRVLLSGLPSLVHALNLGLESARGRYIARMDGDDICLPDRFRKQLAFLERSNVDFLFTDAEVMDEAGKPISPRRFPRPKHPLLDLPLIHPTAMAKRSAMVALGGYGNFEFAEDRHLWMRASLAGFRISKLADKTIRYRIHPDQVTRNSNRIAGTSVTIGLDLIYGLREGRWSLLFYALLQVASLLRWRIASRPIARSAARRKIAEDKPLSR